MLVKTQPVIAAVQDVLNYAGVTAAEAVVAINSGITLQIYIQQLLDKTAQRIIFYLNYDYTVNQKYNLNFTGDGSQSLYVHLPVSAINAFTSFDPSDPQANTMVNIGAGALAIKDTNNPYVIYRIDGQTFLPGINYYVGITQATDPNWAGWPIEVIQTQVEMVTTILRESANSESILNILDESSSAGNALRIDKKIVDRFLYQLRPYKRFAI